MKIISSTIWIFCLCILWSCNSNFTQSSVKIDGNTVSVKTPWASVEITESGVSLGTSGASISISDGRLEITGEWRSQGEWEFDIDASNCDLQYENLLKKYGNIYDGCFVDYPSIDTCMPIKNQKPHINIAIIFDTSWSMGAKIGSETMIDIAKEKVSEYISSLDSDVSWWVIIYGQEWDNSDAGKEVSCKGIALLGEFRNGKEKIIADIRSLKPNGWTPIDASLKFAESFLRKNATSNDRNIILLISDGKETCDGNPVWTAKDITSTVGMYIDVIGFNVQWWVQQELINIAKSGNGKYTDVRSRADFDAVFHANKNFLSSLSCGASKAALQLQAAVERKNRYYSCMHMLKEEEIKIITNASEACKNPIQEKLESRSGVFSRKLEKIDEASETLLENFDKNIEALEESFQE